jgi:hypothetical protein
VFAYILAAFGTRPVAGVEQDIGTEEGFLAFTDVKGGSTVANRNGRVCQFGYWLKNKVVDTTL